MKKLSLRMRLTLATIVVLILICSAITLLSIYNSRNMMASFHSGTVASMVMIEEPQLDDDGLFAIEVFAAVDNFFVELNPSLPEEQYESNLMEKVDDSHALIDLNNYSATILTVSRTFDMTSIYVMVAMIVLGGVLVYFALGFSLKPAKKLSSEIQGITENKLANRLSGFDSGDEINSIADSFNSMIERLETAFLSQKQFSTAAAHELKTPIAVISANIDVLKMDADPSKAEYARTINVISSQVERMTELIDDLFKMSALEQYDMEQAVEVKSVVLSAVADLKPVIAQKQVKVTANCDVATVSGNKTMLGRAIANIIENAVKYNREGGRVEVAGVKKGAEYALEIADTGIGVPKQSLARVFDAFYRVDDSRSRESAGAGLGLALAKEIIGRHGGTITAEIEPQGGMRFTIQLPCKI